MLPLATTQSFNCVTDYGLERLNSINVTQLMPFFINLPADPYLTGNYRFRRFSRFSVSDRQIVQLPHTAFFQSKRYNSLLGNVPREYAELDQGLIQLPDFAKIVLEFFDFCQLCSTFKEVGVHQIRITADQLQTGSPAPEGIHRDGVDLVGIFCVNRDRIEGGETHLYTSADQPPVFQKILNSGELLVFSDHQFLHFTTAVHTLAAKPGIRDVFVLTCPGLPFLQP